MTSRRRWLLFPLLGALAGLLTFFISLPLFPHKSMQEALGPMPSSSQELEGFLKKIQSMPPLTTLGTPYGNLAYFLLGGLVSSFLVAALRAERNGPGSAFGFGILAFLAGGILGRGADALSDTLLAHLPALKLIIMLPWGFLVGSAIALVIWLFQGPTLPRLKRAVIAGIAAGIVSFVIRLVIAPAIAARRFRWS